MKGAPWPSGSTASACRRSCLKYRLKEYGHPAPLRDVLRAVRLLRSDAPRWGIAPDRIGVLGFSAGGHLAASAGTLFDEADGRTGAALDTVSARPDFMILVYPVIRLVGPHAHTGSGRALLGANATPETLERFSLDTRVTKETPPAFLVHGGTDTAVPAENSIAFSVALRAAGVPAELHLYQSGVHGIGLRPGQRPDVGVAEAMRGVDGRPGPAVASHRGRVDLRTGLPDDDGFVGCAYEGPTRPARAGCATLRLTESSFSVQLYSK